MTTTATRLRPGRHARTTVTLLVLLGVVAGATLWGWNTLKTPVTTVVGVGELTGAPCAPTKADPAPATKEIELNVFNGTDRNGLASKAAKDLRTRGFVILEIANAESADAQAGVALVRGGIDNQAEAAVVMGLLPGAVFEPDNRDDGSIDVFFGEKYKKLAKAKSLYKPKEDVPECVLDPAVEN